MTPREVIDKIVAGEMRAHAALLEEQVKLGCQDCGRRLVGPDGQVIDPKAVVVRGVELLYGRQRAAFRVSCNECARRRSGVAGIALEDTQPDGVVKMLPVGQVGPPTPHAVIRPGEIAVFKFPVGKCVDLEVLKKGLNGATAILIPDNYDAKTMNLEELRQFRDQINEVIYDRERGG